MSRPFKFRYVNEIAGTFVLLTLGLLLAVLIAAGRMQGWTDERRDYVLELPSDSPTGLRKGSGVIIFDSEVGTVRSIRVAEDGRMTAVIRLRGDLVGFVRDDSTAVIRKKFGLAGDAYVEISRGEGKPLEEGAVIEATLDEDVPAMLITMIREISNGAKFTMFQVNQLLREYTKLASSLQEPVERINELLGTLNEVGEDLQAGEGSAGRLLKDPGLHDEAVGVLRDIRSQSDKLDGILANVRRASDGLPGFVDEAPELVEQATATLAELERLLESLQRHWLLRRYAEEAPAPVDYRIAPRGDGR